MGLVQGEKPIIYPILEWLLPRVPELQKRAYLAKYLLKIDVPADIMQEEEVNGIYMQVGQGHRLGTSRFGKKKGGGVRKNKKKKKCRDQSGIDCQLHSDLCYLLAAFVWGGWGVCEPAIFVRV